MLGAIRDLRGAWARQAGLAVCVSRFALHWMRSKAVLAAPNEGGAS